MRSVSRRTLARPTLRASLLLLAGELEIYADRSRQRAARTAYREAAEGLRRTLARFGARAPRS